MPLYDHRGRKISTKTLGGLAAEGRVGTVRNPWGHSAVAPGLTPDRLGAILRRCDMGDADALLTLAEEMEEREPHYASVMFTRKLAVASITPEITPASDDAQDEIIAQELRQIVQDPCFADTMIDLLDAVGKPYSVVEIDWVGTPERWVPHQFVWADPRFFKYDHDTGRELRLRSDDAPMDGEPLPPGKFIVHRSKRKSGLDIRGGVARLAAWSYIFKQYTLKDWLAFVEVYGMPMRIGKFGPNASDDDIDTLLRAVLNLGTDAAAVIPESMRIEFEQAIAGNNAAEVFKSLADWLDRQVSKAVNGQTMSSDDGSSLAQANVHNDVRHDYIAHDARQLAATLQRDLIRVYVEINFGRPANGYPTIKIPVRDPEDIKAIADATKSYLEHGLTLKAAEVRARLGWTDPEPDDEVIGVARQTAAAPNAAGLNALHPRYAAGLNAVGTDEVDALVDDALDDWQQQMDPILQPIRDLVAQVNSMDELLKRLPEVLQAMDVGPLAEALTVSMMKGYGLGDATDNPSVKP